MTIEDIQTEIRQDIDLYYSLHPNKTPDLLDYCLELADELTNEYIKMIDKGIIRLN